MNGTAIERGRYKDTASRHSERNCLYLALNPAKRCFVTSSPYSRVFQHMVPTRHSSKIMATYPHEETPLTEHEKAAYSRLLYWAMIDIRTLCQSRGPATWSPLEIWQQYHRSRVAGALADWLHNLAFYAACDFRGFNTDEFWREQTGMARRFSQFRPDNYLDYRRRYNEDLARLEKEQKSA